MPAGVHSHGLAPASARRRPTPCTFRPRRSSRPRRLAPPPGSRACCVPHPTLRFIGLPRTGAACLRPPPRFPTDACPPELFPSEKRSMRHRMTLPPCRSSATPTRLRGLAPLGNPLRRTVRGRTAPLDALLGFPTWSPTRRRSPRRASRAGGPSARRPPPPPEGGDRDGCTGEDGRAPHHCAPVRRWNPDRRAVTEVTSLPVVPPARWRLPSPVDPAAPRGVTGCPSALAP